MTGGYLDPKRCRLELFSNIRNLMEQKKEIQVSLSFFFSVVSLKKRCLVILQRNLEAAMERNNERTAAVERLRMKGQDLEREVSSRK